MQNDSAGTLTLTAFLFPMILGFSGLGLDATSWYMSKRTVQNLVDMASLEAVHSGEYFEEDALEAQVVSFLEGKGYDEAIDTVTVSNPPTAGAYAGRDGFYEISISRDVPLYFSSAFYKTVGKDFDVRVVSRAVAGTLIIGTQCIVALDPSADRALDFSGTADVVAECGVASNSVSDESIYVGGNASLTADPAMSVGDIEVSGGATLITNSPLQTYSEPTVNPYEDLDVPPFDACDVVGNTRLGDDDVAVPGRYCGDIRVQGQNITFDPGTYIIDGGDFISNANAEFFGEDVTFIFTGDTAGDVGTVNMNGNTTAELTAPTSGDYTGILFYQDPKAEYRDTLARFNGGADLILNGVIYFPSGDISFTGGSSADPACLQIFAATVSFSGNSVVGNEDPICEALNMEVSPQVRVQLVE
jgi:plastocyanin